MGGGLGAGVHLRGNRGGGMRHQGKHQKEQLRWGGGQSPVCVCGGGGVEGGVRESGKRGKGGRGV